MKNFVPVSYFFRADNYTDITENFHLCVQVTNSITNFHKRSSCIFVTLHRKHFESFFREVPLFSDDGCSEFDEVNWPLFNISSLSISP